MRVSSMSSSTKSRTSCCSVEDENGLRRGPWTVEEDTLLINAIALHGQGRWNLLSLRSGLRRTGKSCRLRWLNYLKPDVKRGNLSPQEQLLILELHSRWGNSWSKIAQQLPGRTDNEIKNYWRTRVQKQAKLLNIDANSPKFKDIIRCFWIPRLLQQINNEPSSSSSKLTQTQSVPKLSESDSPSTATAEPKRLVSTHEKRHRFAFEKSNDYSKKHEVNLDPYHNLISSCISPSESMDISSGSDPFSDVPSWNHDDSYDMKNTAAADFGWPTADCHSQLSDWMADESDAGCFWNFGNLWQF